MEHMAHINARLPPAASANLVPPGIWRDRDSTKWRRYEELALETEGARPARFDWEVNASDTGAKEMVTAPLRSGASGTALVVRDAEVMTQVTGIKRLDNHRPDRTLGEASSVSIVTA